MYGVVVVGMEQAALLRRLCQRHDGLGGLVDGRELHGRVAHIIGIAAQHVEDSDAAHRAVGLEVDLELAVGGTRCEVAHTHDLSIQSMLGDGIKDDALRQELGMDILVGEILSEIEHLLRIARILSRGVVDRQARCAVGRDVYQLGIVAQAEVHAMLRTSHIHVLNLCSFGEVLHHGSAIEDRVHLAVNVEVLRHVAIDDAQPIAEQLTVALAEVVIQQTLQPALSFLIVLASHQTPDDRHIVAVNQLLEDMDSEEARSPREQHITDGLLLAVAEGIEGVVLKDAVDARIVEVADFHILVNAISRDETGQQAWRRVGEHVAIGDMMPSLVRLDNHTRHHQRCAAQFEEVIRGAHAFHLQDVGEDVAELFLRFSHRLHIFCLDGQRRFGQRLHVCLAARRGRHLVELQVGRGHHVLRQALADLHLEFIDIHRMIGREVGAEMLFAVDFANHHDHLADAFLLSNHTLNLTQLDAQATQLHLVVGAPEDGDVALFVPSGIVARAIQRWVEVIAGGKRVGDKGFARLVGQIVIT